MVHFAPCHMYKGVVIKMKKNLIFREILLYVIFFDIVLNLSIFITGYNMLEYKIVQYFEMAIRIFFDYLLMFYLWYPVRYEEYNENNVDTHILDWSVILLGECIFCIIFLKRLERAYIIFSLLLLVYIFMCYRYILLYRKGYQSSEIEFVTQMEKDIRVILPLVGCYIFSVLGLNFTQEENLSISLFIIIYTCLLFVSVFLYCVHSIKHVICMKIYTNKIIKTIICSILIFFVILLGILVSKSGIFNFGIMERTGINIYFILTEILLILLLINKMTKVLKE